MDYTRCEEEIIDHSPAPCASWKLIASEDMDYIVYASYPVSIRFSRNKWMEMTTNISEVDTYADMLSVLSVDEKEKRTIEEMKNKWFSLIGQLNADGSYDEYTEAYITYANIDREEFGVLRSRARNQKALMWREVSPGLYFTENIKEVGMPKNDGTAFIFAKIPEFKEIIKKMNEDTRETEDIIKVGSRIPWTDDFITEVWTIDNIQPGVRMVRVNYQKKWIPLDIKTWQRVIPEKRVDVMDTLIGNTRDTAMWALATKQVSADGKWADRMVAVLGNPVHHEVWIFDEFLSKIREQGH